MDGLCWVWLSGSLFGSCHLLMDSVSRTSDSSHPFELNRSASHESTKERKESRSSERVKKKSSWYNALYPTYKSRSEDFRRIFKDVPPEERLVVGKFLQYSQFHVPMVLVLSYCTCATLRSSVIYAGTLSDLQEDSSFNEARPKGMGGEPGFNKNITLDQLKLKYSKMCFFSSDASQNAAQRNCMHYGRLHSIYESRALQDRIYKRQTKINISR
ncbi:hypothetical protein PR048_009926 [Dryococelus australis]|uniref:Uncharacterized protein n=1 Tax=Dryococelus australis TaxID=614101 RepID=A0ABQ9I1A1_9NEOP|nr:hypothetical protein PR048_009926 [Dryococelus australis]